MKKIILAVAVLGVLAFGAESGEMEQEQNEVMTQEQNMIMNKTGEQDGLKEMTQEQKKIMIQEKSKNMNQNRILYPNNGNNGGGKGKK